MREILFRGFIKIALVQMQSRLMAKKLKENGFIGTSAVKFYLNMLAGMNL